MFTKLLLLLLILPPVPPPPSASPQVITRTALLEFRMGSAERGRGVLEGVLQNYPKRLDLWSLYIDQVCAGVVGGPGRHVATLCVLVGGGRVRSAHSLTCGHFASAWCMWGGLGG